MAKYPSLAELETLRTAEHEAGHAMSCLLVNRPILEWNVVPSDVLQRLHRRQRKNYKELLGPRTWGYIDAADSKDHHDELCITLGGTAAEQFDLFFEKTPTDHDAILEEYGPGTDESDAWLLAQTMHTELGADPQNENTLRCVEEAYAALRTLFADPIFKEGIFGITQYMMRHSREIGGPINERMEEFLAIRGTSALTLIEMRRRYKALNIPGIVRSHAFA